MGVHPMRDFNIVPYERIHKEAVLDLTLRAWAPVFERMASELPAFVYEAFYPSGWEVRQRADVADLLDTEPQHIWLAFLDKVLAGFIGIRLHPEDQMGEILIIAVSPSHQHSGTSQMLMRFGEDYVRGTGSKVMMVETVDDTGHAPALRAYEAFGFQRWPVARFFKPL